MLVFIDESGDPGFKLDRGSTPIFVAAMVIFQATDAASSANAAIATLATKLNVRPEFKFNKSDNKIRDAFFAEVSRHDFKVRAISVRKEMIYSPRLKSDKEQFYRFFVKNMVKFDNAALVGATVVIDGSGDRAFQRDLGAHLRRHTNPGAIKGVTFKDSRRDCLVQLADMCVGAIARSYRKERKDHSRWRLMLAPKIQDVWDFS